MRKSQPEHHKANRDKIIEEMVEFFNAISAPGEVTQIYSMQVDNCYCGWIAAAAAARQLYENGHIAEEQIQKRTAEFATLIIGKIKHGAPMVQGPQTPPGSNLVIPQPVLPKDIH